MKSEYDSYVRDRLPKPEHLPVFRFDTHELQYPERLNAAAELLSSGDPEDLAIRNDHGEWTYAELDDWSGRISRLLIDDGLIPGNRVFLNGANTATLFACWLGVIKAGGIAVAANPLLRKSEVAKMLKIAQISRALVDTACTGALVEAAQDEGIALTITEFAGDTGADTLTGRIRLLDGPIAPVDTHRDDPAILAFTSGTTGQPKACVQFHRDILACADSFARHILKPEKEWRWSSTAPLAFTFGLGMQYLFPLRFGGTIVTVAKPGPTGLLEAIEKHHVNVCATAPTGYLAMIEALDGQDISSLKRCVSAGEHLPEHTWRRWKEATGLSLIDGIGATEMMHIFISASDEDIVPGATGKTVPGYEATILDNNDKPIAVGTGRLAVRGPTGCRYMADTRQADYVVRGWNVTGDTYRVDKQGYFWYVARSDDMIVSSGYNIAATEVEDALLQHEAVAECAVIGVPDEKRGHCVKAFVCLRQGYEASEGLKASLQDHVKATIAPYKYPREIAFIDALPKTSTGKLQRNALKNDREIV